MNGQLSVIKPSSIDFSQVASFVGILTPESAAQLMERNHPNNRNVSPTRIRRYQRMIDGGMWGISNAIYFSDKGVLINGQHRLSAIIASGKSVPVLVTVGLPVESAELMDQGANRTANHIIQFRGVQNNNSFVSIIRMLSIALVGNEWGMTLSPQEVANLVDHYYDGLEFSFKYANSKGAIKYAPVLLPVFMAYYDGVDKERLEDFLACWHTGTVLNGNSDNSVMLLRVAYYKLNSTKGYRDVRLSFFRKSQTALNYFIKGESPKALKESTRLIYGEKIFSKESLLCVAKGK